MELLLISFFAGILTVLSPCVFTLLPVILGGSLQSKSWRRPIIIIISLEISILIISLILKASTALITVPQGFWSLLSGTILILLGVITIFPELWAKISLKFGFSNRSEKFLHDSVGKSENKKGILPDILTGVALGPVFSSCSPTYALIIATILPASFIEGFIYLIAYVSGLGLILLLISIFGQRLILKLRWATNPKSKFKIFLGILFILIGIFVIFGWDKDLQAAALENDGFLNITRFEINLLGNK